MFETSGSLSIVERLASLVGLVGLPLAWSLFVAFAVPRSPRRTEPSRAAGSAIGVAVSSAVLTVALATYLLVRLTRLPSGHVFVQHVSQLARLGQLDLAFDLALDLRAAVFVLVTAAVALASVVMTSRSARPGIEARLAWSGVLTTGVMLVCVGDGFAPILIGLGVSSLGTWGLSRGGDSAANVAAFGGNVSVLVGFIFLFWSLGGVFGPEGYDPDGAPRFVLVSTNGASSDPEKATLAMTTYAGALVSSDDADLPGEPVVAPMSIEVTPGVYTLRVQRGAASGDVIVPRVALARGREHVLTPYGPTTSLRNLTDQFSIPLRSSAGAAVSARAVLAGRTLGGLRASAIVLLFVIGGALLHLHALASRPGPSSIAAVLEAIGAPLLALRLAPLVEPTGADGALVVLLGAGSAVVLAARAACVDDGQKALRGVVASSSSAAVAAVGLGHPSAALVLACTAIFAAGATAAALEARRDVRWLGVACAAAAGLLPGAGVSFGWIGAIAAAIGSAATGTAGWAVFSGLVALALALAVGLGALASFRVYGGAVSSSSLAYGTSRAQGAVVVVLAATASLAGIVLGAGTAAFGGKVVPLADRVAGPVVLAPAPSMALAAAFLALVAAASGAFLARRAAAAPAPPSWLLVLGRPHAVVAWAASGVADASSFLERSVVAMDRDVVDDVPAAIGELGSRAFGRRSGAGVDALTSSTPAAERFHVVLLSIFVAILGLVVLSSVLLG